MLPAFPARRPMRKPQSTDPPSSPSKRRKLACRKKPSLIVKLKIGHSSGTLLNSAGYFDIRKVPVEIWDEILTSLDICDQAACALTCKIATSLFRVNPIRALNESVNRSERLKLLYRLGTTFPEHYLCGDCVRYHPNAVAYQEYKPRPLTLFATQTLTSSMVTAAMKAVRVTGSNIDASLKPLGFHERLDKDWTFWVKPRVFNGRLLLVVPCYTPITIKKQQEGSFRQISTCQHMENSRQLLEVCNKMLQAVPKPWSRVTNTRLRAYSTAAVIAPQNTVLLLQASRRKTELIGAAQGIK